MHVNLHLTHACNLRCTYCYTGAKAERHMSWEVARRAVDFALARSTGAAQITFFGGEPLLCMDLMRRVVQRARRGARKKGSHVQFELSTNGTLVDSAFCDFVREEQILVSLSIDGARRAHDAHRVFPDRSGSHQLVSAALRSLLAASPLTMTMSVVTPETVSSLAQSIRSLFEAGARVLLLTLDFTAPWTAADFKALKAQLRRISAFYLEQTRAGQRFFLSCFDNKIRSHVRPGADAAACSPAMESVSVAPSGNLYPCVQFVHDDRDPSQLLGDVFEGFDQEKRSRFVAAAGEGSASCRGCALNGRCNNRCACLNIQTTGRPNQVSPILCEYERLVTPIADRLASRLFRERAPGFMNKHYNCLYPYLALLDGVALQKEAVDEAI